MYSPQEEFLYQAEVRARGVDVFRTGVQMLAALGKHEEASKAYIKYLDAVFPENEWSREQVGGGMEERILEQEMGKVYDIVAHRGPSRAERILSRPIDTDKQWK